MALDDTATPVRDHGGDKVQQTPADKAESGALNQMQAEAIPPVGQNPAAASSMRPETRGMSKGGADSTLPKVELFDSKADQTSTATDTGSTQKDGKPVEPFTEVSRSSNFDEKKPTVAFIDEFHDKNVMVSEDTNVAHGEISRQAAEKAGFNTIALQISDDGGRNGTDYSKQINAVADQIENGKLPLGKGDALNISMGNTDPTFKQASEFLGFDVNAGNVAAEKDHIIQRMGEIAKDPSRSDKDRETANRVVNTNAAIDRVQSHGVEVVQAAGNAGPDRLSWDFLNAKTQLSSNRPSGKADEFSAEHSLTTKGDGVLPVTIDRTPNMFDPTPLKNQAGTLTIGDTGVQFPERGKVPFMGNNTVFDREKIKPEHSQPRTITSNVEATSQQLIPNLTITGDIKEAKQLGDTTALPPNKFTPVADQGRFTKAFPVTEENKDMFVTPKEGQQLVTHYIDGTSFSNMKYFAENRERMAKMKAGQ